MAEEHDETKPVAQETALDQRTIPFLDDELIAALTTQGDIYINLPGMCRALGLDSRGQLQRIRRQDAHSTCRHRPRWRVACAAWRLGVPVKV